MKTKGSKAPKGLHYTEAQAWLVIAEAFLRREVVSWNNPTKPPTHEGTCTTAAWLRDRGDITVATYRKMRKHTRVYVDENEFAYGDDHDITQAQERKGRAMWAIWMALEAGWNGRD
jgi:hypothetical protein